MPRHVAPSITAALLLAATAALTQQTPQDVPPPYRAILQAEAKLQAARDVERGKVEAALKKDRKLLDRMKNNSTVRATLKSVTIPDDETKPVYFQTREQKLAYIGRGEAIVAKGEARVAELSKPARYEFKEITRPLEVGDVGQLSLFKVLQVLDKTTMIVSARLLFGDGSVKPAYMMLKNQSTVGVVDDQLIKSDTPLEAVGTTTYKSVDGGTRTVVVIQPIDLKLLDSYRVKK